MGAMIELTGLTKVFGRTRAVDDLTCTIEPGVVTGFLGPNGAGKTTTMRMILGLDHPTSGSATIDGKRYGELTEPLRHVGALLDARQTHPNRSVRAHLRWIAATNRLPAARVDEVLDMVGLTTVAGKRAGTLSLGMSQRLGIAAALLGDPPVLLFDEPGNGLDPEGIVWLRGLVKDLAGQGRTVLVSSHLMSEMALTAEHLVVIGRGRLLADTTVREFIAANSRSYIRVTTPDPGRLRAVLRAEDIEVTDLEDGALAAHGTDTARLGELVAAHGVVVHEIAPRSASLEEAFVRLTAGSVEFREGS
jgi:ABC-2 type transport system ATP-binding protein